LLNLTADLDTGLKTSNLSRRPVCEALADETNPDAKHEKQNFH